MSINQTYVSDILKSKQYADVIKFLDIIDKEKRISKYFITGNSQTFFDFIESKEAFIISYEVKKLKKIIQGRRPWNEVPKNSLFLSEIVEFMNANKGAYPGESMIQIIARQMNLSEEEILKKFIAPLTALRRLTFIYGFMKLYQRIHKLPEINVNLRDLKYTNDAECKKLVDHLHNERDKLKEIVVKLMLFHSEYMEVGEVDEKSQGVIKRDEPVKVQEQENEKKSVPIQLQKKSTSVVVGEFPLETKIVQLRTFLTYITQIIKHAYNESINIIKRLQEHKDQKGDDDVEIEEELKIRNRPRSSQPKPLSEISQEDKKKIITPLKKLLTGYYQKHKNSTTIEEIKINIHEIVNFITVYKNSVSDDINEKELKTLKQKLGSVNEILTYIKDLTYTNFEKNIVTIYEKCKDLLDQISETYQPKPPSS